MTTDTSNRLAYLLLPALVITSAVTYLSSYVPEHASLIILGTGALIALAVVTVSIRHGELYALFMIVPLRAALPPLVRRICFFSLVALIILRYIQNRVNGTAPRVPAWISIFFVVFIAASAFSMLQAVYFKYAALEFSSYCLLAVFIVACISNAPDEVVVEKLMYLAIINPVIRVLLTLPEVLSTGIPFINGSLMGGRLTGFLSNANVYAVPFMLGTVAAFGKAVFLRSRRTSVVVLGIQKGALFLLALGFVYIVLLTNSRSALGTICIACAVIMAYTPLGRKILVIGATGLFFVVVSYFTLISVGFRFAGGVTGRDIIWNAAFQTISAHPFFGVGPGNFEYVKGLYILPTNFINSLIFSSTIPGGAFNLPLTVLAEIGIFGFIAVLYLLVNLAVRLYRRTRYSSSFDMRRHWIYISVFAFFCGVLFRLMFEDGIIIGSGHIAHNFYFIIMLLAITCNRESTFVRGIRNPEESLFIR